VAFFHTADVAIPRGTSSPKRYAYSRIVSRTTKPVAVGARDFDKVLEIPRLWRISAGRCRWAADIAKESAEPQRHHDQQGCGPARCVSPAVLETASHVEDIAGTEGAPASVPQRFDLSVEDVKGLPFDLLLVVYSREYGGA
jgi:hypothetical protein